MACHGYQQATTPTADAAVSPRLFEAAARNMEVQSRITLAGQHFRGVPAATPPPPPPVAASKNQVSMPILPALATSMSAALRARQQLLGQSSGHQRPDWEEGAEGEGKQGSAEEEEDKEKGEEEEEEEEGEEEEQWEEGGKRRKRASRARQGQRGRRD